ncbi:hypothetical protein SELMODRAFT_432632 [Selaginella moellendorffii]|uniref:Uncharacterized protein n=1 Tax=Selaginella moellendorffii TaxID=88036 RepID=D8TGL3_SELML|nr:hypothetical protein SELMODRAFT_432632 [Selaginella moellendorffii]
MKLSPLTVNPKPSLQIVASFTSSQQDTTSLAGRIQSMARGDSASFVLRGLLPKPEINFHAGMLAGVTLGTVSGDELLQGPSLTESTAASTWSVANATAFGQWIQSRGSISPVASGYVISGPTTALRAEVVHVSMEEEWPRTLQNGLVAHFGSSKARDRRCKGCVWVGMACVTTPVVAAVWAQGSQGAAAVSSCKSATF